MGYFPASGYRTREYGGCDGVGINGYSWSVASVSCGSVHGSRFKLSNSWIGPLDIDCRAYGFPVRCVQELAVILYRSVIKARSAVECSDSQ